MKSWLISVLIMTASQLALADDSFGRLFSTPKERANLDYLRQSRKIIVPQKVESAPQSVEVLALTKAVELQGYVKRSDGKQGTVWINQQAIQEGTKK